jgi:hypothetical protein
VLSESPSVVVGSRVCLFLWTLLSLSLYIKVVLGIQKFDSDARGLLRCWKPIFRCERQQQPENMHFGLKVQEAELLHHTSSTHFDIPSWLISLLCYQIPHMLNEGLVHANWKLIYDIQTHAVQKVKEHLFQSQNIFHAMRWVLNRATLQGLDAIKGRFKWTPTFTFLFPVRFVGKLTLLEFQGTCATLKTPSLT